MSSYYPRRRRGYCFAQNTARFHRGHRAQPYTSSDDTGKLLLSSTDDAVRSLVSSSDDAFRVVGRNVVDDMVDDWYGARVNNADSVAGNWDEDISNALAEDAGKEYNGSVGAGAGEIAARNYINTAVTAQNNYADKGVSSMNDLIDTNITEKTSWYKADGTINMPPNNGAVLGTKEIVDLQPGKRLGRYGGYTKNSDFLAEAGSSAESLSLPPYIDTSIYQEFEIIKLLPRAIKSLVEPWGNSTGWGTQYQSPLTIEDLIREGYLK